MPAAVGLLRLASKRILAALGLASLLLAACSSPAGLSPDTAPPELLVITPLAGEVLGRNGTATFGGSVSDDREVVAVKLLDGVSEEELATAVLGERTQVGTGERREWTIQWQPEGDGERLLALLAVDGAGNETPHEVLVVIGDLWFRDADGDGYGDPADTQAALEAPTGYVATGGDCDDGDSLTNPLAQDDPDLDFIDRNCDGIDGEILESFFVSPLGSDDNPGTPSSPFATPAVAAFSSPIGSGAKKIIIAAGTYVDEGGLSVADGLKFYGGYDPVDWTRSEANVTRLVGTVQGVLASGDTDVLLQLLTVEGRLGTSASVYGIRAINAAELTLERVDVIAGDALAGADGASGRAGEDGEWGWHGDDGGSSDEVPYAAGGRGGYSLLDSGVDGGDGGEGGWDGFDGYEGYPGEGPAPGTGGAGGAASQTCSKGEDGSDGWPGGRGSAGLDGAGGSDRFTYASSEWHGDHGEGGGQGTDGSGGGGGGGGGGHSDSDTCSFTGSGGGGGGAGGEGGYGGQGGLAAGGSFGIYIWNATVSISDGSTITAGNGGAGGDGGAGGLGGSGGEGGYGGSSTGGSIGLGGSGGRGGDGGPGGSGGGAAGGPSIGVFRGGTSPSLSYSGDTVFSIGTPGEGGTSNRFQGEDGVAATVAGP